MLYKEIICPECGGYGYVTHSTENSISSSTCTKCMGTGLVAVAMTNGDIIRTCSNENLMEVHANLQYWAIYSGGDNNRLLDNSPEDFLLWLNKEADKIDLDTIFGFINEKDYEHPYLKTTGVVNRLEE